MKKRYAKVFVGMFFSSWLLISLNEWFQFIKIELNFPKKEISNSFKTKPIDSLPQQIKNYTFNNSHSKKLFVNIRNKIKAHVFGVSTDRENVVIGNNNRYFFSQTDLLLYQGLFAFDKKETQLFLKVWNLRKAYFENKKIPFHCIIAPCGLHVYEEQLPWNCVKQKNNPIKTLLKNCSPEVQKKMIYALDILRNDPHKEREYFRFDNHWNDYSGILMVEMYLKKLKEANVTLPQIALSDFKPKWKKRKGGILADHYGDNSLVDFEIKYKLAKSEVKKTDYPNVFTVPKGFPYPDQFLYYYKNPKVKTGKKLLLFRDSFGFAMYPFLNEYFSEVLVIWDSWEYKLNADIVEHFKPDAVLYVIYEPHIKHVIEKDNLQGPEKILRKFAK